MKDLNDRFETWYRLTHWMSPPLDRRAGNGEYEDAVVHCMYLAYRAGFNRARKESKAELRRLHEANEAFGKRQEWWNERMFELEQQRDELLEALKGIIKAEHSEGRGGSGFIPKAPTLEHQRRVYQAWQKAHAAIAKVEGEKQ